MSLERNVVRIFGATQRIGIAGRSAPTTGELDPVAVALDTHEALLHILGALEDLTRRVARMEAERR